MTRRADPAPPRREFAGSGVIGHLCGNTATGYPAPVHDYAADRVASDTGVNPTPGAKRATGYPGPSRANAPSTESAERRAHGCRSFAGACPWVGPWPIPGGENRDDALGDGSGYVSIGCALAWRANPAPPLRRELAGLCPRTSRTGIAPRFGGCCTCHRGSPTVAPAGDRKGWRGSRDRDRVPASSRSNAGLAVWRRQSNDHPRGRTPARRRPNASTDTARDREPAKT